MLQLQLFEAIDLAAARIAEADRNRLARLARSGRKPSESAKNPLRWGFDRVTETLTVASGFATSWRGAPHA